MTCTSGKHTYARLCIFIPTPPYYKGIPMSRIKSSARASSAPHKSEVIILDPGLVESWQFNLKTEIACHQAFDDAVTLHIAKEERQKEDKLTVCRIDGGSNQLSRIIHATHSYAWDRWLEVRAVVDRREANESPPADFYFLFYFFDRPDLWLFSF